MPNSNNSQLPTEVTEAIQKWIGSTQNILYFWEDQGTYYVVQQLDLLYFLRLFKMGDKYAISQDHECEIGSGYIPLAR